MSEFMRRITGALMVVVGGFFIVAGILAVITRPSTAQLLRQAPFITDGVLDPANEGKTVVLAFNIEDVDDAYDPELGLSFPYPCVSREVEKLTCTLTNQKWEWRRTKDTEETVGSRFLVGDIGVGDFQIEGDLLRGLALYKDIPEDEFDSAELTRLLSIATNLSPVDWNSRFYLTNCNSWTCMEDYEYDGTGSSVRSLYQREMGSLRIRYKGLPRAWYSRIAVIGKQDGNWIVEDDRIDDLTVYEDVSDIEALIRKGTRSMYLGIILVCVPCAFLMLFGMLRLTGGSWYEVVGMVKGGLSSIRSRFGRH